MATFDSRCPFCRGKFEAEDEWIGENAECPSCGKEITIEKPVAEQHIQTPPRKQPLCLKRDTALKVQDSIPNTIPQKQSVNNFEINCSYNLKTGQKIPGVEENRESKIAGDAMATFDEYSANKCPNCGSSRTGPATEKEKKNYEEKEISLHPVQYCRACGKCWLPKSQPWVQVFIVLIVIGFLAGIIGGGVILVSKFGWVNGLYMIKALVSALIFKK